VGAKSPVEGVFGREEVGVLARDASGLDGVLAGVTGVLGNAGFLVAVVEATECPVCCGRKGCAIAGVKDCFAEGDFKGVLAGVLVVEDTTLDEAEAGVLVVAGFEETLEVRGLLGVANLWTDASVGVAILSSSCGMGGDAANVAVVSASISVWDTGRSFLQFSRNTLGPACTCRCEAFSAFAVRGTSASSTEGTDASFFHLVIPPGSVIPEGLEMDDVIKADGMFRDERDGRIRGGFSTGPLTDLGGHSRFSFVSSRLESPVIWDTTLELRGGELADDRRFVCVSNRPIRLATLCRGRSSGSGLAMGKSLR
jgi:hypothetical protein